MLIYLKPGFDEFLKAIDDYWGFSVNYLTKESYAKYEKEIKLILDSKELKNREVKMLNELQRSDRIEESFDKIQYSDYIPQSL